MNCAVFSTPEHLEGPLGRSDPAGLLSFSIPLLSGGAEALRYFTDRDYLLRAQVLNQILGARSHWVACCKRGRCALEKEDVVVHSERPLQQPHTCVSNPVPEPL